MAWHFQHIPISKLVRFKSNENDHLKGGLDVYIIRTHVRTIAISGLVHSGKAKLT
jgi:hypothetical protein